MNKPLVALSLLLITTIWAQSIEQVEEYRKQYNYPQALSTLQALVSQNPNNNILYRLYAQIYFDLERYPEARSNIQQALLLSKQNATNFVISGNIYRAQKNFEQAELAYQNAIKFEPGYVSTYYEYALLSLDLGRLKEAERLTKLAQNFSPNAWQNYVLLAQIQLRKNQISQAQQIYFDATTKFPYEEKVFDSFISFYLQTQQIDKAIVVLKKANDTFGFSPLRARDLGNLLTKKKQYREALSYFLQSDFLLNSLNPKEVALAKWRIFSLYQILGEPNQAIDYIRLAFEGDSQNQLYLASLFHLLTQDQNSALPVKNDFTRYLEKIANEERKKGAGSYYQSILFKILRLTPDNTAARNELIRLYRLQGNEYAVQELLKFNQLFLPNDKTLENSLDLRSYLRRTDRLDINKLPLYTFVNKIYLNQQDPTVGEAIKFELQQLESLFPNVSSEIEINQDFTVVSRTLFQNNTNYNIVTHITLAENPEQYKITIYDKKGLPIKSFEMPYQPEFFTQDLLILLQKISSWLPNVGYITKRLPDSSFELALGSNQGVKKDQIFVLMNTQFQPITTIKVTATKQNSSTAQLIEIPKNFIDIENSFVVPIENTSLNTNKTASEQFNIDQVSQTFLLNTSNF